MFDEPSGALFGRGTWRESLRVADILRRETVGGALLLVAAACALIWSNSPWQGGYFTLREATVGPGALHLDLTLGQWAADGLLTIFFFVAGLELKREFTAGDLRDPRRAALPVFAAVGGMIAPALIFVAINTTTGDGALRGWAIPTATDIAFALAVLAVISTHLPTALRTFLLTLAVVDDLLAILIIAVFYTADLDLPMLLLAAVPLALFGVLMQRRFWFWPVLVPLAVLAWALVHASGVHATVAGVVMGFTVPVLRRDAKPGEPPAGPGLAEHLERFWRPVSAGFAVPVFAFFSAGVAVGGFDGLARALRQPITLGVIAGLVVGKALGVLLATFLMQRLTRAELDSDLAWWDVFGLALLAGLGFTVSLLIAELAYGHGTTATEQATIGVLAGSLIASALAAVVLRARNRTYRRLELLETEDVDADGVPDIYQRSGDPGEPPA